MRLESTWGGMIIKGRDARNGDNIEIDGSKCSLPL